MFIINNILNLRQSTQLCIATLSGGLQALVSSWLGKTEMAEMAIIQERFETSVAMYPAVNLKPMRNHKNNLGGAR